MIRRYLGTLDTLQAVLWFVENDPQEDRAVLLAYLQERLKAYVDLTPRLTNDESILVGDALSVFRTLRRKPPSAGLSDNAKHLLSRNEDMGDHDIESIITRFRKRERSSSAA